MRADDAAVHSSPFVIAKKAVAREIICFKRQFQHHFKCGYCSQVTKMKTSILRLFARKSQPSPRSKITKPNSQANRNPFIFSAAHRYSHTITMLVLDKRVSVHAFSLIVDGSFSHSLTQSLFQPDIHECIPLFLSIGTRPANCCWKNDLYDAQIACCVRNAQIVSRLPQQSQSPCTGK